MTERDWIELIDNIDFKGKKLGLEGKPFHCYCYFVFDSAVNNIEKTGKLCVNQNDEVVLKLDSGDEITLEDYYREKMEQRFNINHGFELNQLHFVAQAFDEIIRFDKSKNAVGVCA